MTSRIPVGRGANIAEGNEPRNQRVEGLGNTGWVRYGHHRGDQTDVGPFPAWHLLGTSLPGLIECPLIQDNSHDSR